MNIAGIPDTRQVAENLSWGELSVMASIVAMTDTSASKAKRIIPKMILFRLYRMYTVIQS